MDSLGGCESFYVKAMSARLLSSLCRNWQALMANGNFQTFLLLTILASTIQLLLENPIKSQVGNGV
jgi:hypothetical protein